MFRNPDYQEFHVFPVYKYPVLMYKKVYGEKCFHSFGKQSDIGFTSQLSICLSHVVSANTSRWDVHGTGTVLYMELGTHNAIKCRCS